MPHPHLKHHPSRRPGYPISLVPRRETTRHIHRPHASYTPTAHHHHHWQLLPFPHSPIALAADPPGSSEPACVPRVCLRVTYAPAPSYVGRRTSYTLSQQRGACRAWRRCERAGGAASSRAAQRRHRHTACSQGNVRAPPAPHRAFSLAHVASAGVPLVLMHLFVRLDTLHE
jgi:hypothetical protein